MHIAVGGTGSLLLEQNMATTQMVVKHAWLVIKDGLKVKATAPFVCTIVQVTTHGNCHFKAALGTQSFVQHYRAK